MQFRLSARRSSENQFVIRALLEQFVGKKGTINLTNDSFEIEAHVEGESAKDLNRKLLFEIRKVEKQTRLRAEWTSGDCWS
jgi:hypothetical protein